MPKNRRKLAEAEAEARNAFTAVAYADAGWRLLPGSQYLADGKSYEERAAASDKARRKHPDLAAAMDTAREDYLAAL